MALREVLQFPDERLRTVATSVEVIDERVKQLIDDMLETMREENGVGLAATQIDVHKRIVVMDVSENGDQPLVLINPEIIEKEGTIISEEGCLSVPGNHAKVERAAKVKVRALNREGEEYELEGEGLLAKCVQHELDHLQGKLFVDYLSPLKRQRIKKKLEKEARIRNSA